MEYTSRVGDRPTQAHVNYNCPCGCVAGLTYDREAGSEHLGQCCCGRILWVGTEAEEVVRGSFDSSKDYRLDVGAVVLPWRESQPAVLAEPLEAVANETAKRESGKTPTKVVDPVCKMMIDPNTAVATSRYQGSEYYFCAESCKARFDASPKDFAPPKSLLQRLRLAK